MAFVSEYNRFIHDLRDMVATILPKHMEKCIKVEEFTAYSTKKHADFKVTNLYVTIKDVTIIVSFDFEDYNGLNVWVQNDNEGEGATVGVVKSRDAVFQFIKAVLILNKVIKS